MSYKTFAELRDEAARVATPRYIEIFNWALEHSPFDHNWEAFTEAFCDLYDYEAMSEDEAREWAANNACAVKYFLEERRDWWACQEPLSEYDISVLSRLHDEISYIGNSDKGDEQYDACFLHNIYSAMAERFPDIHVGDHVVKQIKEDLVAWLSDGYSITETLTNVRQELHNRLCL